VIDSLILGRAKGQRLPDQEVKIRSNIAEPRLLRFADVTSAEYDFLQQSYSALLTRQSYLFVYWLKK
jgi:hypothetical protein